MTTRRRPPGLTEILDRFWWWMLAIVFLVYSGLGSWAMLEIHDLDIRVNALEETRPWLLKDLKAIAKTLESVDQRLRAIELRLALGNSARSEPPPGS